MKQNEEGLLGIQFNVAKQVTSISKQNSLLKLKKKRRKAEFRLSEPKQKKRVGGFTRKLWNRNEDEAIAELVAIYGTKKWALVSRKLQVEFNITGRSGKQCRERWHNHLDPNVRKAPISPEEEERIFLGQRRYGNKWAKIAKLLPGRPDNVVKNHFYSTLRRQLRKVLRIIKGESADCPNRVSIEYMWDVMAENKIPYTTLDNKNVKALLEYIDSKPGKSYISSKEYEESPKKSKYYLYLYFC